MGCFSSVRCRMCSGTGKLELELLPQVLLFEWIEGYEDDETPNSWLESQLRRLIAARKDADIKYVDDDSDLIDEDP